MANNKNLKIKNYSPLRYPGGKVKLYPLVSSLIKKSNIKHTVYIEPFAGGAGLALSLLYNNDVDEIVINDYDKAVYSMWRAILTQSQRFIQLIQDTPVTIEEWHHQKNIYLTQKDRYSLELGFATFYLNRANRSGIITAGPIGGYEQNGNYKIDVRFNKDDLIKRVKKIASYRDKIHLYNHDVHVFIKKYVPQYIDRAFIYFDPPYYDKGKMLYKNFFTDKDHKEIYELIKQIKCPWIVTYDNVKEIRDIYSNYSCWKFDLVYGVANSGLNSEILYISDENLLPNEGERTLIKINLRKST
jgi:DNA adenine methylase